MRLPSTSGSGICMSATDTQMRCFDFVTGELIECFMLNQSLCRSLHIRGFRLSSLGLDGDLAAFDLERRETLFAVEIPGSSWQRFVHLSSRGDRIVTCGADGIMRFRCAGTGLEVGRGYHMEDGTLWMANDEPGGRARWFCGDRDDLVDAVGESSTGSGPERPAAERDMSRLESARSVERTMGTLGFR